MHLSGIARAKQKFKTAKERNAIFENLTCLKNNKNILMLLIYQNRYGECENHKRSKYSASACMWFLHVALHL